MTRWLVLLACAACSRDIRLGDVTGDAASDSTHALFAAGNYSVTFLDPAMTVCQGTLAGHETDFSGITRASSSLVDGTVQVAATTDQLMISGAPIQTGFTQSALTLVPDPASTPATLWDTSINGSFGTGPDTTYVNGLALAFDSATASAPSGIQGAYGRAFFTASGDGQCTVVFGALLVMN